MNRLEEAFCRSALENIPVCKTDSENLISNSFSRKLTIGNTIIITVFPLLQWLHERTSMLSYTNVVSLSLLYRAIVNITLK